MASEELVNPKFSRLQHKESNTGPRVGKDMKAIAFLGEKI
jgi:hypothetical protein